MENEADRGKAPSKACIELHYLPCVQYFSLFSLYDEVCIEACEHYQKRSYRNRCHIGASSGMLRLSVPLASGKHAQQPIREVRISDHSNWRHTHWQSLRSAYGKTPFFEHYAPFIQHLLFEPHEYLFDLSIALLKWGLAELGISDDRLTLSTHFASTIQDGTHDWRNRITPGQATPGNQPFEVRRYVQPFSHACGFLPNLSIIDLLCCTGPEAPLYLNSCFQHPPAPE